MSVLKIAKVIVDVASSQTNQAYDYIIPEKLEEQLTIGYRVSVPFGVRTVQGFIVDIVYVSDIDQSLKEISDSLDAEPILTHELVALGQYLSQSTYAFLISCYHVMLPSLLKANYDKRIEWVGEEHLPDIFGQDKIVPWDTIIQNNQLPELLRWKKRGQVIVHYDVKNKAKHKVKKVVWLNKDIDIVIRKNAHQQQMLFQQLSNGQKVDVITLTQQGISSSTIQTLLKKQWILSEEVVEQRDHYADEVFQPSVPKQLNDEQTQVYQCIKDAIKKREHRTFLLEGVTGSGKTEVYLQLISDVIHQGQTALLLVPEIALTPQMVKQFKERFGQRVAVLHSALSDGEKYDEWVKIKEGKADIVVGARSSIFAPLENIGIIIIDEEHETTYKQMDTVRYHAREVALWRGKYHHAPIVLGSATPSLESRARAQKGVYTLLQMKKRANQQLLPTVHIVDMTKEKKNSQLTIFSETLKNAIADRLAKKEQMVLFLNRRGYSSFVMCRDCGHVIQCPNCDISLTLHMDTKQMKCHYCGHEENIPQTCPKCLGQAIRYFGMGTQKVEEELLHLFPQARVIRMDVDTTRRKGDHKKLLTAFGNQEADILLGTQMIAKGLDFPNITLVGIINADTSLNLPDFRATEKTYQLLTQVAGRAGRGDLSGEVFVQTYNPEHYVIQLSKEQNYEQFYLHEMRMRHLGKYSPYFYTTSITVTHTHEATALKTAYDVKQIIQQYMGSAVHILGPSTYSIARMQNKYYFQIILKYKNQQFIDKALQEVMQFGQTLAKKNIYLSIDVEPLHFI